MNTFISSNGAKVTIAEDGSVIIPREVLDKLALYPQENSHFRYQGGSLIMPGLLKTHLERVKEMCQGVVTT
jgi:hypothetical protein